MEAGITFADFSDVKGGAQRQPTTSQIFSTHNSGTTQYRRTRAVLRSSSRLCRRPLPGGGAGRSGFCVRALHKVSIRSADISRSAATHITFTGGFPVWRERYRFRHFGPNDGLNTAVSRLVQNRAGFLWVATGNGLFRYD